MELLMDLLCTTMTLIYAGTPYTMQLIPKGSCHFCCPFSDQDVKLYLNIPGEPEIEFDWEKGSDWRRLDNNRTTVFYIHGFTEQATGPASTAVKQAYMSRDSENLILVDWSTLAAGPWYPNAVHNTYEVAKWLAGVIDSLVLRGLPLDCIHIIGFSLGAEIAGITGKQVSVGKIRRITGLDPALPLYHTLLPNKRLSRLDAEFVDVIHTDGYVFGFGEPIGHADFFPNGGKPFQPGCKIENFLQTGRESEFIACSHNRAWKFYSESLKDPFAFPAYQCTSFHEFENGKCPPDPSQPQVYMGILADPVLRGKFYLDTHADQPFGFGVHTMDFDNKVPSDIDVVTIEGDNDDAIDTPDPGTVYQGPPQHGIYYPNGYAQYFPQFWINNARYQRRQRRAERRSENRQITPVKQYKSEIPNWKKRNV